MLKNQLNVNSAHKFLLDVYTRSIYRSIQFVWDLSKFDNKDISIMFVMSFRDFG